ncbi:multiple cyclophane-containing RiPP AmcA [Micromonospora sp. CPCC 205539]|uniref:multiple cyclophane-containing RiPP AmcA n=1 Tax=Micromonospora sp. CPCC 205539 TaxID=3122408 RepID=UPI002FF1C741
MPETTSHRRPERDADDASNGLTERVRKVGPELVTLLQEAEDARRLRAEVSGGDGAGAVCAWNHFENIPTFYNWNNRPR